MKKNNVILVALVIAVCVPALAFAAFTPSAWQWKKPITLSGVQFGAGSYVKINLDQEASANSMASLADLRVVRDGVVEVPYQVVTETSKEGMRFTPATILSRENSDGDTIVIVDVGTAGLRHNAVEIGVTNPNFRRQISLYSSDVLLSWNDPKWGWINPSSVAGAEMRSTDAFIYRFTDNEIGFTAEQGLVRYPETTSRYVRFVIHKENNKKELLNVATVRAYQEVRPTVVEDVMEVRAVVNENEKEQSTEVLVDLLGGGLPVKSLTLHTDDPANFNRRAVVHGSQDGVRWNTISQGYLFQVRSSFFNGTELTLRFTDSAYRYFRVVIFNEDNQPLLLKDNVTVHSVLRSVVFDAQKEGVYGLYYGNANAVTPRYDLGRYFQYVESVSIPRVALGNEEVNQAFAPELAEEAPMLERNKSILNGVLVFLVAIITFITIGYLKKLKLSKGQST